MLIISVILIVLFIKLCSHFSAKNAFSANAKTNEMNMHRHMKQKYYF